MEYIMAPIGGGKTSLTHLLAKDLQAKEFLEKVEDMPMLKEFYAEGKESRSELSFRLQIAFLNYRYNQLRQGLELKQLGMDSIFDSNLLSDGLMAKNLAQRGEMPNSAYNEYITLSQNMQANVSGHPFTGYPDLIIYLNMSFETMLKRIQGRGRDMEDVATDPSLVDYYHSVWELYQNWYKGYGQSPIISIDMDKYDYVNNKEDQNTVLDLIESKMVELNIITQSEYDTIKQIRYS